jgi:hypothetical protein
LAKRRKNPSKDTLRGLLLLPSPRYGWPAERTKPPPARGDGSPAAFGWGSPDTPRASGEKRTHPGIVGNLVHALGAAQSDTDSVSGRNGIFTDSRKRTRSGIDCHWKRRRDRHQLHATTSGAMPVRKEGGLPASINCKLSGIVRRRRGWIVVTHCGAAWADRPRPVCPFTQAPKHD